MKETLNQKNLLQTSLSSAKAATAALKRAQLLRSHANKIWTRTPTAAASPSTIRRNNNNANVLFQSLPPVDRVADPLFMETSHWLKSQKLPADIQIQQQQPQLQQPLTGRISSLRGIAAPIVNSQQQSFTSAEALKEGMRSLSAPLPD